MKVKRLNNRLKRKISKECWNLDYSFIKWLNQHLKVYLKDADKIVDLDYHKFTYNEKEWTQREIIERLIFLTDQLLIDYSDLNDFWKEYTTQMLDLWKVVFPAMWW